MIIQAILRAIDKKHRVRKLTTIFIPDKDKIRSTYPSSRRQGHTEILPEA